MSGRTPQAVLSTYWLRLGHGPLILLATIATVITSQPIVSGAYSMTQQAINLGFLPCMHIIHNAGSEIGQICVPFVNWALAVATLAATIHFGSPDGLACAFGIEVRSSRRSPCRWRHLLHCNRRKTRSSCSQ